MYPEVPPEFLAVYGDLNNPEVAVGALAMSEWSSLGTSASDSQWEQEAGSIGDLTDSPEVWFGAMSELPPQSMVVTIFDGLPVGGGPAGLIPIGVESCGDGQPPCSHREIDGRGSGYGLSVELADSAQWVVVFSFWPAFDRDEALPPQVGASWAFRVERTPWSQGYDARLVRPEL